MALGSGTSASFRGTTITGHVEDIAFPAFPIQVDEAEVFGLRGTLEIIGDEPGGWIQMLMHLGTFATNVALQAYIEGTLRNTLGLNGTLVIGAPYSASYLDCTLRQVEKVGHDRQRGPLQNGIGSTWTEFVLLTFRRLS